jgi:hypothetical protein
MKYLSYLEVVYDAFTIQEVIRNGKEIPVKSEAPWIFTISFGIASFSLG